MAAEWEVELSVDPDGWAEHADLRDETSALARAATVIPLVTDRVSIGRAVKGRGSAPDIDAAGMLLDPAVSHCHCTLTWDDAGQWFVSDDGSSNGTIANGRAVTSSVALQDGSVIEIGAWTRITLRARR